MRNIWKFEVFIDDLFFECLLQLHIPLSYNVWLQKTWKELCGLPLWQFYGAFLLLDYKLSSNLQKNISFCILREKENNTEFEQHDNQNSKTARNKSVKIKCARIKYDVSEFHTSAEWDIMQEGSVWCVWVCGCMLAVCVDKLTLQQRAWVCSHLLWFCLVSSCCSSGFHH